MKKLERSFAMTRFAYIAERDMKKAYSKYILDRIGTYRQVSAGNVIQNVGVRQEIDKPHP